MILKKTIQVISVLSVATASITIANAQPAANQMVWDALEYVRDYKIDQEKTDPDDAINTAIESWEDDYGSDGATESEELLQLSSDRN